MAIGWGRFRGDDPIKNVMFQPVPSSVTNINVDVLGN